jgi:assimilatory nitrate reductase catalytic subunit
MLEALGGVQWPAPAGEARAPNEHRRLFADGRFFTDTGRARFLFAEPRPLPEAPGERFPLLLLTGRGSSAQWHTGTRTGKSAVLRKLHAGVPYVEVSPVDAARLGLGPTDWVRVRSARGEARVRAFITHVVQPGQVFMPMHDASTNQLTFAAFDPFSRQPAYKACAVRLEKLEPHERPEG